jgi:hypothetical protein
MSPNRSERLFELKWKDRTREGGSGISELAPEWVAEQCRSIWVIDVRERDELVGPLGHIPGSTWVPLERVAEVPAKLGREVPVGWRPCSSVASARAWMGGIPRA